MGVARNKRPGKLSCRAFCQEDWIIPIGLSAPVSVPEGFRMHNCISSAVICTHAGPLVDFLDPVCRKSKGGVV